MSAPADPGPHRPAGRGPLLWALLVPLAGAALYLGLILALGTTHPFQATVGRSMEPLLHTGDLAVMQGLRPEGVALGDVIAIEVSEADRQRYGYPRHALHRVIDIRATERGVVVQTKGDNQAAPDPFTTPVSEVHSRLKFHVPKLGYVLFYLQSTQGRVALAGLVALFLLYEGVRWITDTAEELIEDGEAVPGHAYVAPSAGLGEFTDAIAEYGTHLRSHTRIVQGLGDTTDELRAATVAQREVVSDLRDSVRTLAARLGAEELAPSATAAAPPHTTTAAPVPAFLTPPRSLAPAPVADAGAPRSVIFADLVSFEPGRLVIRAQGFVDGLEQLRFGVALETALAGAGVAFAADHDRRNVGFFTIATADWMGTLTQMRALREFSVHLSATDAAGSR